jgi:hypothetical protein
MKKNKNKKINITKKLTVLVKTRKTPIVVYEQGSIKNVYRKSSSSSFVNDSYSQNSY